MNAQFSFFIKNHELNTESGQTELFQSDEGIDEIRWKYHEKYLVFENRREDVLIYEFINRFEVFSCFSGYIERSVFWKHSANF